MATKKTSKKASTAKSAPHKAPETAATKTTVTRIESKPKASIKLKKLDKTLPSNLINIVLAEAIGTFVLTLVAVLASSYFMLPLYVGLTLVVMVLAIGAISGAHINPAVTFGLWSMRKLKTILVPFYWAAQFLGAMAAVVLLGSLSGGSFAILFGHFMDFSWGIFALELIGTAIFLFGLGTVVSRSDLQTTGKAIGIGMSLMIGLVATNSLVPYIQSAAVADYQEQQASTSDDAKTDSERNYPREVYIGGATLNPAVALAVTEKTDSQLQGSQVVQKGESAYSRLSLEVIVATLIGAALGGNLALLVNHRKK